jgi:hypothetical protein
LVTLRFFTQTTLITYIYVCVCVCVYVCMCVCIYVCMYVCMYVCNKHGCLELRSQTDVVDSEAECDYMQTCIKGPSTSIEQTRKSELENWNFDASKMHFPC